jgi:hypothetical protein
MKLVRTMFFALAVLLPTSWTVARAAEADEAPAETKKEKKTKKGKKADKDKGAEGEKKAE